MAELEVMPVSGFLVVMKPQPFVRCGERRFQAESADYLGALRQATRFLDPARYRGMGREPVEAHGSSRETWERFERLGLDPFDRVLGTAELARRVLAAAPSAEKWEIVYAANASFAPTSQTIGYDLGSLQGNEFYSLISDCVVIPTWHRPDRSDFPALANNLRSLNEHVLFRTPSDALEFRAWYVTRPWAEHEQGDSPFTPVRIDIPSVAADPVRQP